MSYYCFAQPYYCFATPFFKTGKIAFKRDNVNIPIIINLSDELLEIIGLYIAEFMFADVIRLVASISIRRGARRLG